MNDDEADIQEFLSACPVLAAEDQKTLEDWEDEPAPDTIRLSHLGRAYAYAIREVPDEQRKAVAEVLERWMTSDCQNLRDLAATGFIEALAVIAQRLENVEEVAETLRPESLEYYRFWLDPKTVF